MYLKTILLVFVLTLLSSLLHAQQTTTVVRIVDGDTLKVRYWGKEESIRLVRLTYSNPKETLDSLSADGVTYLRTPFALIYKQEQGYVKPT